MLFLRQVTLTGLAGMSSSVPAGTGPQVEVVDDVEKETSLASSLLLLLSLETGGVGGRRKKEGKGNCVGCESSESESDLMPRPSLLEDVDVLAMIDMMLVELLVRDKERTRTDGWLESKKMTATRCAILELCLCRTESCYDIYYDVTITNIARRLLGRISLTVHIYRLYSQ